MPGLGVPQLECDDGAGSGPGEPEPAADLVGADVPREHQLECPGQRRRGRRVAVRQADRQARRAGRRLPAAGRDRAARPARPRRPPARRRGSSRSPAHIAATSASRCVSRARPASSGSKRLAALSSSRPASLPRCCSNAICPRRCSTSAVCRASSGAGLDRDQQAQRRVERAGIALRPGRREQALRTAGGFGRQHRRALEERGRRGQAPARLCSAGRALKLLGDVLVGAGRSVGPVPGVAVRIDLRIRHLRQRTVRFLSLLKPTPTGRPPSAPADGETARGRRTRAGRPRPPAWRRRSEIASRSAARQTSSGSPMGSAAASCSRRRVSAGSASIRRRKVSSMLPDERHRAREREPARQLRRRQSSRQLQQRERVAARLADDLVADPRVQRPGEHRVQQRVRIVLRQTLHDQLGQSRQAHRSARAPRRPGRPIPPPGGARRTRGPVPRRDRATAASSTTQISGCSSATSESRLSTARADEEAIRRRPGTEAERGPQRIALRRR